ncbi:MAG: heme exporter protein CcmD [Proteobacteria bacterium]|nr:heme exporter protein CcmD [Pseudomonadota bacterium]
MDFGSFLAMGGYAAYVWPAYGAALVILLAIWIDGSRRRRAVDQALHRLEQQRNSER